MTHEGSAGPGLAESELEAIRKRIALAQRMFGVAFDGYLDTERAPVDIQRDRDRSALMREVERLHSALRAATAPQDGPICEWDSVVEDETGDYSTSCGKEFQSLDGEPPTFIKFCCYCGKPVTILPAAPQVAQEGQP